MHARGALPEERRRQVRNVLAPDAQRRQFDFDDIQAVEQVAAEPAGRDLGAQVAVGGGNHRHVDVLGLQ